MSVNKYKIRLGTLQDDFKIKIPVNLDFASVGQSEVVNRDFVEVEVEKSINPIIDYERARFIPTDASGNLIKDIIYKLSFLDGNGSLITPTHYSDIDITDDDIRFNKNRFKKSFLRLRFYDSDKPTNQNLITFITIFPKLTIDDLNPMIDGQGNQLPLGGLPLPANQLPVRFILKDPIREPEGFHEGYHLYYFKNELNKNDVLPKYLYMRAEFNNASNGKITNFITTTDTLPVNELIGKLHTRYALTRTNVGYFYSVDQTYNGGENITLNGTNLTVNLYEIKVQ
jgi:hypothetical protein